MFVVKAEDPRTCCPQADDIFPLRGKAKMFWERNKVRCACLFPCALRAGEMAFVPELWLYRHGEVCVAMGICGVLTGAGITERVKKCECIF